MKVVKAIFVVLGGALCGVLCGFRIKKAIESDSPNEEKKATISADVKKFIEKVDSVMTSFGWDWFTFIADLLIEGVDDFAELIIEASTKKLETGAG